MPGEATQRIVLCGPYAAAGAHDPHPVTTVEGQAWCPGNPPRHPDGSPVTGDDVREQAVPPAGELRALTDEVRALQAERAGLEETRPRDSTPLRAEEYAVTVGGITCRVLRRTANDDVLIRPKAGEPAWWEAMIGRATAHETMIRGEHGRAETVMIQTNARFAFNPEDVGSEQIALERAGSYCEQVARALSGLWRGQDRIFDTVNEAVSRARVVCGALPE